MILNILFPQYCYICGRKGNYICNICRKALKRNLPECYICRRISPNYSTHNNCKKYKSLERVFVGWEYNEMSSIIIKKYKYKCVYDISKILTDMFLDAITNSGFYKYLKDTLLIPVSSSFLRKQDRGFNQTELIAQEMSKRLSINYSNSILRKSIDIGHQSLRDRNERINYKENNFNLNKNINISTFKSITILDDVITTGTTIENVRKLFPRNITVQAICLFRGKPLYSTTISSS
ncbi:MAG: hypothetical protein PHE21_01160 [Candidatus Dojkabacteria bacterium]|nr:hypothetical protein [Candidatus Dojkabacteria bacterium]